MTCSVVQFPVFFLNFLRLRLRRDVRIRDGKLRQVVDIWSVDLKKIWTGILGPAEGSTLHCDVNIPAVGDLMRWQFDVWSSHVNTANAMRKSAVMSREV